VIISAANPRESPIVRRRLSGICSGLHVPPRSVAPLSFADCVTLRAISASDGWLLAIFPAYRPPMRKNRWKTVFLDNRRILWTTYRKLLSTNAE
jgi:hypothetical protein